MMCSQERVLICMLFKDIFFQHPPSHPLSLSLSHKIDYLHLSSSSHFQPFLALNNLKSIKISSSSKDDSFVNTKMEFILLLNMLMIYQHLIHKELFIKTNGMKIPQELRFSFYRSCEAFR
jgi:hypothetical protein